jgi:TrmH family RNA methyltransferase
MGETSDGRKDREKGEIFMDCITSRQNSLCTHLRRLGTSAAYRRQCGEFLCDSPKLLREALLWRSDLLKTVVYTEGTELPELPEGLRLVQVTESVMKSVSPAKTPQGLLGVCGMPAEALPERLEGKHPADGGRLLGGRCVSAQRLCGPV